MKPIAHASKDENRAVLISFRWLSLDEDIMFVDIGVYLYNGERAKNRTLVIKDRDGKWYVDPDPSASPLLSDGLNEESASVVDLTDVYELEAQKH